MQIVEIEGQKTGRKLTRRFVIGCTLVEKIADYQLALNNPLEK